MLVCPPPINQVLEVIGWEGDKRHPTTLWVQNIGKEVFVLGDVEAPSGVFCGLRGVSVDNQQRFTIIVPDEEEKYWHRSIYEKKYWHRSIYGTFKGKLRWPEEFQDDPEEFQDDPRDRELEEEFEDGERLWRERVDEW